jgi:nitrate/nitrite transporter NarK
VNFDVPHVYGWTEASVIHSFYTKNEEWLQAAQFIHSVVALPLVSAVCSKVAATFLQQQGQRNLTLRHTIVLADRGWSDPDIYVKLMTGRYKKYGSKLLIFAIMLNIIGTPKPPC